MKVSHVSSTLHHPTLGSSLHIQTRTRLTDLDRAKGLAILLVVFGHLVARNEPLDVSWYEPIRIAVYLFHMPLFMYLSGYVAFLSGSARRAPAQWPMLLRRRAERLLVPFLVFGVLTLLGKLLASQFVSVDNPPSDLASGFAGLCWNTEHSPATSIWYILVLFIYSIATPPILTLPHGRALLIALAVTLFLAPLPPVLYMDRIGTYLVFFVAGGLAADAGIRWRRWVDALWLPALALLVAAIVPVSSGWIHFDWSEGGETFPYKWALLLAGLLSMPAVHGLVRHGAFARSFVLGALGRYVFVIYLLNTLCIGAVKAVMLQFTSWNGDHFLPFALTLMACGVLLPIALKRSLFRQIPALDRVTD